MKFFKHYKNKPYTFIDIAKHSETLEDLVVYECRYPNETAKLWVRPKDMFFSDIEVAGKNQKRFAPIPLMIETSLELGEKQIALIAPIMQASFGNWIPAAFHATAQSRKGFHLLTALVEDKVVGFKLGYELDQGTFYSWLGGVLPEFHGLEIATDLMTAQHEWARKKGYAKVQTKTQNQYKAMLMLNLKCGFEVIGTHSSDSGLKIMLEKKLGA